MRAWQPILDAERRGTVTLLYGAHDVRHNGALVLRDYLVERAAGPRVEKRQGHRPAPSTPPPGSPRRKDAA